MLLTKKEVCVVCGVLFCFWCILKVVFGEGKDYICKVTLLFFYYQGVKGANYGFNAENP